MNSVEQILEHCISSSISKDTHEFQWETFFQSWFRERGTPYFFLFKKHMGVTNTQYAELFSLLETHCIDSVTRSRKSHLLFHTTDDIRETLVETLNSVLDSREEHRNAAIKQFSSRYAEVLSSTVSVDLFYCSSAIALPPGVEVDIKQICVDSGYIHSAGKSIFIRNIKKARIFDFRDRLDKHLKTIDPLFLPVPFVVYAHEDFSGYDDTAKDQIKKGIESTKLYLEKMSMGPYRLAEIVEQIRAEWSGRVEIPPPGSYLELHRFEKEKTVWMIGERSLSKSNPTNPGMERYYICYEQSVKSENPFFLFDENKPAWKSHTTLPHSLTAALINITRPHLKGTVICDPFGGTGTTWLESKRLDLSATVLTSDVATIGPLLVKDNLQFFLSNVTELSALQSDLKKIGDAIKKDGKEPEPIANQGTLELGLDVNSKSVVTPYLIVNQLVDQLRQDQPKEEQEFNYSEEFVDRLQSLDYMTRFLFYIALRAEFRYQGGYKRRSVVFQKAFIKSLEELESQIDQLIKVRKDIEKDLDCSGSRNYCVFQGSYSKEVVSSFFVANEKRFIEDAKESVLTNDARKLKPNSVDVIICDPPYGFNTTEDQGELASLYSEFIEAAILALKPRGHFIICLPAESYTGRELPYCTRSDMITNQVLVKAEAHQRVIYLPARGLPMKGMFPPYFWEADKALRRTILHFRLL